MQDTHWHRELSFTLTDGMLLGMLGLVVVTLWWRAIADYRGLRRKERRNAAMQNGDAALRRSLRRRDRVNVVLEFTMAAMVTLASGCLLIVLLPYY
ncbi:hypothetical protein [Pantoea dispersa]|uniref:hypothetical protein n=1 Tax=Pantoea dispersa TaxID=59814 RepID=UPI001BAA4B3D|nr:hypothetical protein [Pantoea dispersa]MBS0900021.1 hypothetical protein [Pantoea dispersa]